MDKKLNIGCGRDIRSGWINADISKEVPADIYIDIRTDVIPLPDESCTEVYASGILEQIGSNNEFLHALNECHRVLIPNGKMVVVVPNAKHAIAHQDPMDVRKFTIPTFQYFLKGDRHYELYGSVYGFYPWSDIQIHENERHILTVTMTK